MTEDIRRTHALAFGLAAQRYDRIRPTYPADAVRWILRPAASDVTPATDRSTPATDRSTPAPGRDALAADRGTPPSRRDTAATGHGPLRVVDLGAGTGILTRVLLALGHEVLPVEPDPAMREHLAATTPGVRPLAGSAERIPLPSGSVDAVVAGQAYHWFDTDLAHDEIARVLRAGGVFGPLWNDRDVDVPWVAELSKVINGVAGEHRADLAGARRADVAAAQRAEFAGGACRDLATATSAGIDSFGPRFTSVERAEFRHRSRLTPESLIDLVRSRSYYLTAPADRRDRLEAAVRALLESHPDLADRDEFELPYVTRAFRACANSRSDP